MNDSFPDLKIELMEDGTGDGLILLEQESSGNVDRVAIHPIHLRYMAEKFGLVATSDPTAQRTIATLARRLVLLRDRIDHLGSYLANHSDHKHARQLTEAKRKELATLRNLAKACSKQRGHFDQADIIDLDIEARLLPFVD